MLQTKTISLQHKLDELIKYSHNETSLPLIIAHSEAQLQAIAKYLQARGLAKLQNFQQVLDELPKPGSNFLILSEPHKNLYDVITQYPMGNIQLTKPTNLEPILIAPSYDATRILLITNHELDSWQQTGYDLLRTTGITLRLRTKDE